MEIELKSNVHNPYTDSIVKSYLQLILSISSKEKSKYLAPTKPNELPNKDVILFLVYADFHQIILPLYRLAIIYFYFFTAFY